MSVSKDGAVVAIEAVIDDRLGYLLKDVLLGGLFREDMIERELVVILGI